MRPVLELTGIQDVIAKSLVQIIQNNLVRATIYCLSRIKVRGDRWSK